MSDTLTHLPLALAVIVGWTVHADLLRGLQGCVGVSSCTEAV